MANQRKVFRVREFDQTKNKQDLDSSNVFSILYLESVDSKLHLMRYLMDIMWPTTQSYFHRFFILIEMKFYSLSFLCDVCNEVHEHM